MSLKYEPNAGERSVDLPWAGQGVEAQLLQPRLLVSSHGARPVHLIITMIKWIRTSRLSIRRVHQTSRVRVLFAASNVVTTDSLGVPACVYHRSNCVRSKLPGGTLSGHAVVSRSRGGLSAGHAVLSAGHAVQKLSMDSESLVRSVKRGHDGQLGRAGLRVPPLKLREIKTACGRDIIRN